MSLILLIGFSTTLVLPASTKFLPPVEYRHPLPIRSYLNPPLMMKEKNQYIVSRENTKMRKSQSDELSIYLFKKPSQISTVLPVHKIFDKNGMVYLSKPKKRDWGFKEVLDEVMSLKQSGFRRSAFRDTTSNIIFNFDELVF
ncbi:hypothetical protein K1T71_014438 [Dendrolimus kikuchii]|uniref:Uncharacterized protein n=1 Tax=Dendrolimus kikuchii TaxID=765133 RepID=A0ACC1CE41_9NEOP|nr:hypothetical protein K1T71_014438 [Dendrolimus kikuchii]